MKKMHPKNEIKYEIEIGRKKKKKKNEKTIIESINEILRPKSRTTHALRTKTY